MTTLGDADTTLQVRLKPIEDAARRKPGLQAMFKAKFGNFEELQFSQVGPCDRSEVTRAALLAIVAASLVILGFMIFAFRKVPNPFRLRRSGHHRHVARPACSRWADSLL